jgi:PleD family two-component response regulator
MNSDSKLKLLLVSLDQSSLSDLETALMEYDDIELSWVITGKAALDMVSKVAVDLVITDQDLGDMSGLQLASQLLKLNPMINCALVSDLSPEKFHETSEGLGLVAQLSVHPGKKDAEEIVVKLKQIKGLIAGR